MYGGSKSVGSEKLNPIFASCDALLESSIGLSSSKTSSSPVFALLPAIARQAGAPISQSKDSVCSDSRSGISTGSVCFAKVGRWVERLFAEFFDLAFFAAAKVNTPR